MTAGASTFTSARAVAAGRRPLLVRAGADVNGAKRTVYMQEDHLIGYPDFYVQSPVRHPMDYLSKEVIAAHGWEKMTIGVEMDNYYFSAKAFASASASSCSSLCGMRRRW